MVVHTTDPLNPLCHHCAAGTFLSPIETDEMCQVRHSSALALMTTSHPFHRDRDPLQAPLPGSYAPGGNEDVKKCDVGKASCFARSAAPGA